ncbi:MAG: PEGA domain-containing protein [Planctomycetota bacterium]|nr:PEGA domain-containing protein [Planctomycetota bacterium]
MRSAVFGLVFLLAGCAARRELVIDSVPQGALIRLDDTVVGTTPFQTGFEAYGTRRVTLYLDGYRSQSQTVEIKPPWYGRFPFDIVSEVLLPVGWRDRHEVKMELVPEGGVVTMPDLDLVLKRAESLRLAEPTGPRPVLPTRTDVPIEPPKPIPKPQPE